MSERNKPENRLLSATGAAESDHGASKTFLGSPEILSTWIDLAVSSKAEVGVGALPSQSILWANAGTAAAHKQSAHRITIRSCVRRAYPRRGFQPNSF